MRFPKTIRLPDKTVYADPERAFHLTISAHPEIRQFPTAVADAIWDSVKEQRRANRVELLAACLMPDHLHLFVRPKEQDVLNFVQNWKSWSTHRAREAGHFGPAWQPGMWDRTCRNSQDFEEIVNYIVRDPVAAGLVDDEFAWPYTWAAHWDE